MVSPPGGLKLEPQLRTLRNVGDLRVYIDSVIRKTAANLAVLAALVAAYLSLAACSSADTPTPKPTSTTSNLSTPSPPAENQGSSVEVLVRGGDLYAVECQVCHGDQQGHGGTGAPPHNQDGHTWHHPDSQLKEWITNGKLGFYLMPAFNDRLTESDVDAILSYIQTWWTPDQRDSQADISRRYQEALDKQRQGS